MHTWAHTPTFRGFEHFVGFYNAAEDHFSHHAGEFLDLRKDTAPLRTANGMYSTILYSAAAVEFIRANAPAAAEAALPAPTCRYPHGWNTGGTTTWSGKAKDVGACCGLCAANASCAAFSFHTTMCYLKDLVVMGQ